MFNTKDKINLLNRKIPYMNKPISEETVDEIGMEVYVDYLEGAIENDADIIAVVSGFGTGKSSLIALLKEKYSGWEERHNRKCKRVYCTVNLWSQLENQDQTVELHRAFLYQLIANVYPKKSSYFSRRTGKNFGMFKISAESPIWSFFVSLAVVVFAIISIMQYFFDIIVSVELFTEKQLSFIVLIGYLFCAVVVILLVLQTELIFSSKDSEGNREIEENELIDLYREHVLLPKNILSWFISLFVKPKHIVVVIEDLDRTDNGEQVYFFLKELRKYYVPSEQVDANFINEVTFIVNIMPEDKLLEKCGNQVEPQDKYVYDKVFDYFLNLNRVNIDNFDAVLEALIREKRKELEGLGIFVAEDDNVHKIDGMQWVILGKKLSLREVKARLNDTIVLYESLRKKFGPDSAELSKCAAVAYLRNAFSKEFYALEDRTLEEMYTWYAKENITEEEFLNKYHMEEKKDKEFCKALYMQIESHLIDGNYRSYFFNYPKDSHLYNVQETNVRNLIIYNEELTEQMKEDIEYVAVRRSEVITDAMEKAIELRQQLPKVVMLSDMLWKIASTNYPLFLVSLVANNISHIEAVTLEHLKMISSIVDMENSADILCNAILDNKKEIIVNIREYLVTKHLSHINKYVKLFRLEEAPLNIAELILMKSISLEHILDMIYGVETCLSGEVIDKISSRVFEEKLEETVVKAERFFTELAETFEVEEMIDVLTKYTLKRKCIIPKIEEEILDGIENEALDKRRYFEIVNGLPADAIGRTQIDTIITLDRPGLVNKDICDLMKAEGLLTAYLMNMIEAYADSITIGLDEVKEVLTTDGADIWKNHPEIFKKIRLWTCLQYKDDVVNIKECFMTPYPIINVDEMQYINQPDVAMSVYDASRADEDEGDTFVDFCNRQFRTSTVAFLIFCFVAKMEKSVVAKVFYKLDMKKVRFSLMGMARKKEILELMRVPLKLNTSEEIIRFMDYTESLIPELEQEILPDLKQDKDGKLCKQYISAVKKSGKITKETLRVIVSMPVRYACGDMINEKLYEKKYYKVYVSSKTQELNQFVVEYDKIDTLWSTYMSIFKSIDGYSLTRSYMYKNIEFLKLIQNRNAYKELPEVSRLALANIPQDEKTLLDVLNYTDEFVIKYFSAIVGFSSKDAAQTFVQIMQNHQKYAQKKSIYDNVYDKLGNAQLKGKYTKLYKRANS